MPSMSGYEVVKWLHVLSGAAWIGGGAVLLVLHLRMQAARDAAALAALATHTAALGDRYFAPLAMLTLLTGAGAVQLGDWGFTTAWVLVGFAGFLASGALAGTVGGRTARAIVERVAADGPESAALGPLRRRHRAIMVADVTILAAVVAAMVAKPA